MNEDISKLISNMMANPDAIKNLLSASSGGSSEKPIESRSHTPDIVGALNHVDDRRITLLNALKPYMGSSRAANVDKAIQLIRLTRLTETLRNEGK